MSLWSALGDVVLSVTDGVTDIVKTAIGTVEEEEAEEGEYVIRQQQPGENNVLSSIGTLLAGTSGLSQAMLNASLGVTRGVTSGLQRAITEACAADSTGEAVGVVLNTVTQSVAAEVVTGVKDVTKSSKVVVKGVRQGLGSLLGNQENRST